MKGKAILIVTLIESRDLYNQHSIGYRKSAQRKNKSHLHNICSQATGYWSGISIGNLSLLTGALKIHEIFIGQDLVVKEKMLPNDPFYKAVLIKESRKKSAVTNILDDNGNDPD